MGRQVNYTHPALGGCFGRGCQVARGANFVRNEGKNDDPMDQNGHGTAVAGVLAGNDPQRNFVGVAPGATLAAYRVVDSKGYGREDDLIAGWLKAVEDGAQIIASSAGFDRSGWAQSPMAAMAIGPAHPLPDHKLRAWRLSLPSAGGISIRGT